MIKNIDVYTRSMQKSCLDKLFFLDKTFDPIETIVDFGCADGFLVKTMQYLFPEHRYVGYDIDDEMITIAKASTDRCEFYNNWNDIKVDPRTSLINASSVIHEVCHYCSSSEADVFWERLFGTGFRYIAVRDMMLSNDTEDALADKEDVVKVHALYPEKLQQFERIWGPIIFVPNMVHYLLKYKYTENWDREVRENYFPITVEEFLAKIPKSYEIIYQEHYALPFLKQQIKEDCGVELTKPTHFKILLKNKQYRG